MDDSNGGRGGRWGRDGGFSLVEVVLGVTIMGTVLVPSLDAVFASVRASAAVREGAQIETVLQNAADRITRAPKRCDYSVYAEAAAQTEGWSANQVRVAMWHLVPGADPTLPGSWAPGGCPGDLPTELLVQQAEVSVTGPSGRVERSIRVVKSDV